MGGGAWEMGKMGGLREDERELEGLWLHEISNRQSSPCRVVWEVFVGGWTGHGFGAMGRWDRGGGGVWTLSMGLGATKIDM
jgi:hypothetical protein